MDFATVHNCISISCVFLLLQFCHSYKWENFVFTQEWPQSACMEGNATGHECLIPSNVTTWTVHGLWPSEPGTKDKPINCNNSWPFKEHDILPLESRLRKYWPNLYLPDSHSNYTEFWAHEWDKHGTCCTDLAATPNEYSYFSEGLLLNMKYNLTSALERNQFIPGMNFSLSQIEDVFKKELGQIPIIQCVMKKIPNVEEEQFIFQVEVCLDKGFSVIPCPQHHKLLNVRPRRRLSEIVTGECSTKRQIQYPPIQHMK